MPTLQPPAGIQINPFGYVSFSQRGGAAKQELVSAGVGTLEVVTTDGGLLELSAHPAASLYVASPPLRVALVDALSYTRLDLNISNESSTMPPDVRRAAARNLRTACVLVCMFVRERVCA